MALIVLGYFVSGTLWAVSKWYLFVRDRIVKYDETKAEWEAGTRDSYDDSKEWVKTQSLGSSTETVGKC